MRALAATLIRAARRARFRRWALVARLRLRWHGMRLELRASGDTLLAAPPELEIHRSGERGGALRLEIAEDVKIGREVEIELHTGLRNELVLGPGVLVASGCRFKLRGGVIEVGERSHMRDYVILKSSGELRTLGYNTLSYGSVFHCHHSITLERGAGVADNVTVVDSDHRLGGDDHPWGSEIASDPVVLGELTSVMSGSVVLKGTRTGRGCVAAAGSVLRGSYPDASLLAGAPAEAVRSLAARATGAAADASLPDARPAVARQATD